MARDVAASVSLVNLCEEMKQVNENLRLINESITILNNNLVILFGNQDKEPESFILDNEEEDDCE